MSASSGLPTVETLVDIVYGLARPVLKSCCVRDFRSHFKLSPLMTAIVARGTLDVKHLWPAGWNLQHLLMFLNFVKVGGKAWTPIAHRWNVSVPTFKKRLLESIVVLHWTLPKVNFEDRKQNWPYKRPSILLDTFECPIVQPDQKPWTYCSSKYKYSLKYEIASAIGEPKVVWCDGPFKGCAHDVSVSKDSGLASLLREHGEMAATDKLYRGEPTADIFLRPVSGKPRKLTSEQRAYNFQVYSARQTVERVIGRLKQFTFTQDRW
eukprot:CAMPEP_0119133718 /NCGR_PEP_ID=MMETSP1310-20130426/13519_1 /TAXON_ID=464262 /ORGANISM="Genus nov. species nov., Strain RCC2339" /LENGTH=264 /DNA_ID=CAMNT_0007124419 /DNA_START=90 /DNA_END=881 /DNA_ORIENTATION=+